MAVCSEVPQFMAVCSEVPQFMAVCSEVSQFMAVCSEVPQFMAVCSEVPQFMAVCSEMRKCPSLWLVRSEMPQFMASAEYFNKDDNIPADNGSIQRGSPCTQRKDLCWIHTTLLSPSSTLPSSHFRITTELAGTGNFVFVVT